MAIVTLRQWLENVEDSSVKAVENVTQKAFDSILSDVHPIKTGRARWSWEILQDESPSGSKPLGVLPDENRLFNWVANKSVEEIKIPFLAKDAVKFGKDINFVNGLHYIRKLEYGGPFRSAPGGMVQRTIQKLSVED